MAKRGTRAGVSGGKEIAAKFQQISREVENEIENALVKGALRVERDAKKNFAAKPVSMEKQWEKRLGKKKLKEIKAAGGYTISGQKQSHPGDKPYVDTGRLRASIAHRLVGIGSNLATEVGTNVQYAKYVEFGTSRAPAYPFLFPAYNQNKDKILKDIAVALKKGCGL